MRVLFVTLGYPPRGRYGTEFYTHQLVHGLAARGYEPCVFHPVRDGSKPRYTLERVVEEGIPVHLLHNPGERTSRFEPSYRDTEVERVFAELLTRTKPDLVHFTYLLWGLSVGLPAVAHAAGIPSVITLTDYGLLCHRGQMFDGTLARCDGPHPPAVCAKCIREPGPYDLPPLARAAKRAAVRTLAAFGGFGRVVVERDLARRESAVAEAFDAASLLIAPTRALAAAFLKKGVPSEKLVELVYSFDDTPYVALRGAAAPDPPRFGFLAQFAPHKGLATLIEAARLLERLAGDRPWELVLHGAPVGGRHALYADHVLQRMGARVRIGAPFEPEEAPAVISGFSAIVLPSEWDENAPLSVLQARALGVPVLGTNVAGIAEALTPEAAKRLVPIGDAEALARRMQDVLDGTIGREPAPGLPLRLDAHLDKIAALYARISGSAS